MHYPLHYDTDIDFKENQSALQAPIYFHVGVFVSVCLSVFDCVCVCVCVCVFLCFLCVLFPVPHLIMAAIELL